MSVTLYSRSFYSHALNGRRVYRLLMPELRPNVKLPLLVLLHGVHGSEIDWTEQGNVMQTMQSLMTDNHIGPMAILMPSDGLTAIGTGYLNWDVGSPHHYEDYLLNDLIPHIELLWNVGGTKEIRAISGLSMGGFAAIRLAFTHSSRFGSASSLSGFFDIQELAELIGETDYEPIFQTDRGRMLEVSPLTMAIPPRNEAPKLYFDCGNEDKYLDMNRQLHERLNNEDILHSYVEHPGSHCWGYWSEHIRSHLIFHWHVFQESSY
jgi:putative tributyrin esterase